MTNNNLDNLENNGKNEKIKGKSAVSLVAESNTLNLSGPINKVDITIESFATVKIIESSDDSAHLTVSGKKKDQENVLINQDNDTLSIIVRNPAARKSKAFNFVFSFGSVSNSEQNIILALPAGVKDLLTISMNGSGDLISDVEFLESKVGVKGSGDIKLKAVGDFQGFIKGSGDISVAKVNNFTINIQGAGDASIGQVSGNCSIDISGAGDVRIGESYMQDMDVKIKGAGDVSAAADVNNFSASIKGAGDIRVKNVRGSKDIKNSISGNIVIG